MAHNTVLHIALFLLVLHLLCYHTLAGSFKECTWKAEDGKDAGVIRVSHFSAITNQSQGPESSIVIGLFFRFCFHLRQSSIH